MLFEICGKLLRIRGVKDGLIPVELRRLIMLVDHCVRIMRNVQILPEVLVPFESNVLGTAPPRPDLIRSVRGAAQRMAKTSSSRDVEDVGAENGMLRPTAPLADNQQLNIVASTSPSSSRLRRNCRF